jgi:hypothetical protein
MKKIIIKHICCHYNPRNGDLQHHAIGLFYFFGEKKRNFPISFMEDRLSVVLGYGLLHMCKNRFNPNTRTAVGSR